MATPHTDIKPLKWLEANYPKLHAVYVLGRFDRPIGWWLLYIPCLWGLGLGQAQTHIFSLAQFLVWVVLFCMGAISMRAFGCVVNDMWDIKFDQAVTRTAGRPLASGLISKKEAVIIAALFLSMGALVWLQLPYVARWVALASLPLIVLYPAMKRVTWWPQAFLGITFNWGILVASALTTATLTLPALVLYIAGIAWTLAYDTIYALQDSEDDALVGIKSTARLFGDQAKIFIAAFFGLNVALVATALVLAGAPPAALMLLGLPAAHAARQIRRLTLHDPILQLQLFKANRVYGLLVFLVFIMWGVTA